MAEQEQMATERLVSKKDAVIEAQRRLIATQQDHLRTFAFYRRISPLYWLIHGLRALRRRWYPSVSSLRQHEPRPMVVPVRHATTQPATGSLPTISIVTPNLDGGEFLEQTLRSVLDQRYLHLEYIVQDGGSTDGSLEVLGRYAARLDHLACERDRGRTHAVNLGFEKSRGEIMAWLSSDDILLPGALDLVGRYFAGHPEVEVVYGHRILIDEQGLEIGRWVLPPHDGRILSWADYVPQETLFWRRGLWERTGGQVDESFRFALDWDLLLRFRDAGARFVRVPRFLGAFRVHEAQQTMRDIEQIGYPEMARLRERCHGRPVSPIEVERACMSYLLRASAYQALYRWGVLSY
jgi:hypothetical protein